ncbi:MAG: oligosaccharide repeat unit polymerase [Gammaproteobacteria bacterium]|nr:oligosaccharide repeat unit polymerase [Gammaproteobacteria bacterium]
MYHLIVSLTGLVIALGALYAFTRTRDGFHPAIIIAPPLGYVYCIWPILLDQDGSLQELFGLEPIEHVGLLYLVVIAAFFLGLVKMPGRRALFFIRHQKKLGDTLFTLTLTPTVRQRVFYLAIALGCLSFAAYADMLNNVGGFFAAYDSAKGGGRSRSGYIGEAVLLSFPAVLLLAISRQQRRVRFQDISLALLMIAPQLLQGTFGGRRGPLFLSLAALFIAWFVAKGTKPGLKVSLIGIAVIGFAVIIVMSQRQHIYLGSEEQFDLSRVTGVVEPKDIRHNDYVAGIAHVLKTDYQGNFYWGYRYLVTIFVRPIPRQLWPTKYQDVGADWVHKNYDEQVPVYVEAVGFAPPSGSAVGFIADIYSEFAWGVVVVTYLFGRAHAAVWRRHRIRGGMWTVLLIEMLILSIYIPTQSFSAWYHRFLFMGVSTFLVWQYWIARGKRTRRHQ